MHISFAQIKWGNDSIPFSKIEWDNYSTSYVGDESYKSPILVTAIPYNGIYSNFANAPLDISFEGSAFSFQSNLSDNTKRLYTYDSSEVYFLTLNIFRSNADKYEFRVMLNGKTEIVPWHAIEKFTDKDFELNNFQKECGFPGGYKTTWGNFLLVQLRKKRSDKILSSSVVYWKETKPVVNSVYTSENLNDFFTLLKRPWDKSIKPNPLPTKLSFPSSNNTIIFYLAANVFKKEAIEYQLMKDGRVYREWGANDFDNNFIWLKQLPPGSYQLKIRYRAQRHNISTYNFEVQPQWQQTTTFKIIAGSLIAAFIGFIALLFYSKHQKKKLNETRLNKEKLEMNLQSIRSQLNPHFVFNALNSIQSLVNKNDVAQANKYLTEFSSLLRESLKNKAKEFASLSEEIKTLETYIKLEQLRFHFNYSISINEHININAVEIPYLLLQPLVENAIKHGVASLHEKGTICIRFYRENKNLLIDVTDNGKGFNHNVPSDGFGLKLTRERIAILNQSHKEDRIKLLIESIEAKSTTIYLIFENWL